MAADTFVSRNLGDVYAGRDWVRHDPVEIMEALMYPGMIFTERDSSGFAYLFNRQDWVDSGYRPVGILGLENGHALDAAYTAGDLVEPFYIGDDAEVYMYVIADSPAPKYKKGTTIVASGTDGYGMAWTEYGAIPSAYYDYTTSPLLRIGICREYRAGSTSDAKIVKVSLSS